MTTVGAHPGPPLLPVKAPESPEKFRHILGKFLGYIRKNHVTYHPLLFLSYLVLWIYEIYRPLALVCERILICAA